MAKGKPSTSRRVRKSAERSRLESEIAVFDKLSLDAAKAGQFNAATNARAKAADMRKALERLIRLEQIQAEEDPIRRLELQRDAAIADGSAIASQKISADIERLKAARLAEEERARAASLTASEEELIARTVDNLNRLPEKLRRELKRRVN